MYKNILLIVFAFCFNANTFAQDPIQLSSSCGSYYGQGTYTYQGMRNGKPFYRDGTGFSIPGMSGGDCSSLGGNKLNCDRDAEYFLIWETDRWYWIREPFQCQWEADFNECVPLAVPNTIGIDGPTTYLYSNTATTPFPPTSGWTILPTCPPNYCEPSLTVLSTESFLDNKFKVYPNPVKNEGIIAIDLGESFKDVKISLYSVLGQLVIENDYETVSQINFTINQPKGIYFVKIKADNDVVIKRIVLE
jgi:Secretion system C-terminal sorting domain